MATLKVTGGRTTSMAIALLFLGLSLAHSTPQATDTTWARLPADLRERVHMSVSEIPPFPEDTTSLRDIRSWPRSRIFDGEPYELMITEWDYDTERLVKSPNEIRPGSRYSASYHLEGRPRRGPSYTWSAEGTVLEQAYYGNNRTEGRVYDPAGRLMEYHHSRPDPRPSLLSCSKRPRIGAEEHFDGSGRLVGFFTDGKRYWAGLPREPLEYSDLLQQWNPWIAWGDSVRRSGRFPR